MNKNQLAQELAVSERLPLSTAYKAIDGIVRIVSDQLQKGESVKIRGFGSLSVFERREHDGHHPQTGAPIKVESRKSVRFKIGDTLHKRLNLPEGPGEKQLPYFERP